MKPTRFGSGVVRAWCVAAFLVFMLPGGALGAGFALFQQGTAAMGQANAFVAEASDPSAIFYNPAGLTQIKRPTFYKSLIFLYPTRKYEGGAFGRPAETNHRYYHTGAVYGVYPFNDNVVLGVGLFNPFGLGSAWPPTWAGRYLTTYSQLRTYNLNPTLAIKLLDNLSLGLGANFMWSNVTLKRKLPVAIPGVGVLPDGEMTLKGFGTGAGVNVGVLYEPLQGVRLGFHFRSETYVGHQGQLDIALPVRAPLRANTQIDGSAGLTYPANITFGVSVNRFKPWTFNVDATWTGWSSYDKLQINLSNFVLVGGQPTTVLTQPKNWHDAWALRFGVAYDVNEKMKLRAGYLFDMTPVPDGTLDPQVPDSNRHVFSIGSDYKIWKLNLGLAYSFIYNEPRTKNNLLGTNGVPVPVQFQANGTYKSNNHSLGFSIAHTF
ncbi:MAG: hypothetical protein FJ128_03410 [Deltaproteobacteria bacterium]|nr:hypothetical protein [Deltaproteobacteria bacterium]